MDERLTDEQVRWHADPEYRRRNARRSLTAEQYMREQEALAREVQELRRLVGALVDAEQERAFSSSMRDWAGIDDANEAIADAMAALVDFWEARDE